MVDAKETKNPHEIQQYLFAVTNIEKVNQFNNAHTHTFAHSGTRRALYWLFFAI